MTDVISHYRLLHELGEGGMGVVYRAEDLRLGREVAVKLLRADEAADQPWLARFEQEARLASSLQHPHICTIHELGQHEGRPFIVMELLEGRTIKQMLAEGPLPIDRAIDYARQVASALDAAHRRGIIHRDIKPANLFVAPGGHLKVLDFGLAKLTDAPPAPASPSSETRMERAGGVELTKTGVTVGTAAYMSPEQAVGAPLDARTDLFSLGSVLYEMATGRRAFPGDGTPLVLARILNGILVPPRMVHPAVPERLEAIVRRLLEVDRERRYPSAAGLLADLTDLARETDRTGGDGEPRPSLPAGRARPASARPARAWALGSALAVLLAAGGAWWAAAPPRAAMLSDRDSILIGAFGNTTGDGMFDETLATALKVHLGQSPFLDIVAEERIQETLRLMDRPADDPLTHDTAREVCQRLGVKAMLEGSIAPLGTSYVLTVAATDCQTGASAGRVQGQAARQEEVLQVLGALSSSMRTRLGESLPSIERFDVPIEQATTSSLAALRAYALGLAERRRGRELESVAFFNQAIELDPEFAAAYTTLSAVYGSLGEWTRSEEYAQLAHARQARVSERERHFITYQYHDRATGDQERAAETLALWKLSYPRDMQPPNALALIHNRMGRYERAVAEAQEALRRSPGHPFPMSNIAFAYRGLGRYDEAQRVAAEAIALGVETTPTRRLAYQLAVMAGDEAGAAAHVAWAQDKPRQFDLVSAQAQVAAFNGRLREAGELYRRAADMALARGLSGTASGHLAHLAWTEALYGDARRAAGRIARLVAETESGAENPRTVPRFRAAAALGLAGRTDQAQALVARAARRYPDGTFVRTVLLPASRAAAALGRGRPGEALIELEAARPAELGTVAALVPIALRADALLAAGRAEEARREYGRILEHRGSDPFAPMVPLAHLGLARAARAAGDEAASRAAYEALFALWAQADAELPILVRARAEYAALARAGR